jgi:hypothetical protein
MKSSFYLPMNDKERRSWLNNFNTQLATFGPIVGISPAEITATNNDTAAVNYILDNLETFKNESKERTAYKELLFEGNGGVVLGPMPGLPTLPPVPAAVPAGVFKRIANMVQRIKHHPAYNISIGKNLGIIGPEKVFNYEEAKVAVTLRRSDKDGVFFDFVKGEFDGVVVYGGAYPENNPTPPGTVPEEQGAPVMMWTEIARAASSPYVDNRKNAGSMPETRYYRMRYLLKHLPVGQESDTITVVAVVGSDLANKLK